jgi:hypothetical protein
MAPSDSWDRLWGSQRLDAPQVESGIWRAKPEDLLAADGSLAEPLQQLMAETSARLDNASDIRVHGQVERPDEPPIIDRGGLRIQVRCVDRPDLAVYSTVMDGYAG